MHDTIPIVGNCLRCGEELYPNGSNDGIVDSHGEQLCYPWRGTSGSPRHEVAAR